MDDARTTTETSRFNQVAFRLALVVVMGCALGAPGCAEPNRPDPGQAFDKIALQALKSDMPFVKEHIHPSLVETETGPGKNTSADEFYEQFANELQRYRSHSWKKSETSEKVVVDAVGQDPILYPGALWQFRMDMIYDRKQGWCIASRAYDRRPMGAPAETPENKQ